MVWASSPSGEFEQKNAYGIARGDCEHSTAFKGNWIWKMDSMSKIKMFIWKCFLLSIPVGEVLQERGIIQDAQCRVCKNKKESILHALRDCTFAKLTWEKLGISNSGRGFSSGNLGDWLEKNTSINAFKFASIPWHILFPFAVWKLWMHRNGLAFKEKRPNPKLYSSVIHAAQECMCCVSKADRRVIKTLIQVRWTRPCDGWYKLNLDGSAMGNPGRASGGGLIRDFKGRCIKGFTCNIGISSSVEAEVWALRDGLSLCISLNLMVLEIEVDAKVVLEWTRQMNIAIILIILLLLWIAGLSSIKCLK